MTDILPAKTAAKPFFQAHGLPIGIQLFPLLAQLKEDFAGTLARIAQIGYRDVELASLVGHSATDFRIALDKAGLTCTCIHVPGQPLFGPGPNLDTDIDGVIANAHALGARDIVMPLFLMPRGFETLTGNSLDFLRAAGKALVADDFRAMAAYLNKKAAVLKQHGLTLSYHNHNFEFAPQGQGTGLDILLRETDPHLVTFELDVGWAIAAGVDVAALLRANPGRITKFHLKDVLPATPKNYAMVQQPASLGHGRMDWAKLLPIAYKAGTRSFFVEQEAPFVGDPLNAMAENYRYLSTLVVQN